MVSSARKVRNHDTPLPLYSYTKATQSRNLLIFFQKILPVFFPHHHGIPSGGAYFLFFQTLIVKNTSLVRRIISYVVGIHKNTYCNENIP